MKITKIEQKDNIFIVTKIPNLLERIFGFKTKVEKYKDTGDTYLYAKDTKIYVNQKGEILGILHKMTKVLENWRRSF